MSKNRFFSPNINAVIPFLIFAFCFPPSSHAGIKEWAARICSGKLDPAQEARDEQILDAKLEENLDRGHGESFIVEDVYLKVALASIPTLLPLSAFFAHAYTLRSQGSTSWFVAHQSNLTLALMVMPLTHLTLYFVVSLSGSAFTDWSVFMQNSKKFRWALASGTPLLNLMANIHEEMPFEWTQSRPEIWHAIRYGTDWHDFASGMAANVVFLAIMAAAERVISRRIHAAR